MTPPVLSKVYAEDDAPKLVWKLMVAAVVFSVIVDAEEMPKISLCTPVSGAESVSTDPLMTSELITLRPELDIVPAEDEIVSTTLLSASTSSSEIVELKLEIEELTTPADDISMARLSPVDVVGWNAKPPEAVRPSLRP